jgi:phosphinothricin acetyltransferase
MIRPATPLDAEAITSIYNPYVTGTTISFETAAVPVEVMATRIQGVLQTHPWLVMEQGPDIVGYAYATRWKPRDAYQCSVETAVYVAAGQVRRGIGASLYQALIPELRDRGFHTALAGIALPNEASVGLHERLGFRKVAHLPQVGRKFGQWLDVGYWALLL